MDDFPQSPPKRARLDLEHNVAPAEDMQVDDPDDFYEDQVAQATNKVDGEASPQQSGVCTHGATNLNDTATTPSAITESNGNAPEVKPDIASLAVKTEEPIAVKQEPFDPIVPRSASSTETIGHIGTNATAAPAILTHQAQQEATLKSENDQSLPQANGVAAVSEERLDADFLAAAQQNKTDETAEWRFDSSDAESSSDESSDTSSDDDESEEQSDDEDGLLDPAEMARILMKEEGGEDGEGDKVPKGPIKTQNELDATFNKPDIIITPDMKTVELGEVDNIISNLALVKANTSGEYRVLESGSLLCLADRRVVGEVFEPLGRVHAPMYSVGFQQQSDMEELGIARGTTIYYVEQHSTYVFTQEIKNLKGTDASNMHDEEAYGDEVEFSDDEQEAEYKRNLKQARQARRAAAQGTQVGSAAATGANGYMPQRSAAYSPPVPQASYPETINYDDDDGDDMYKPLARPDNLSQMMGASPPPLQRRPNDNQRGNFHARGRGDRGRGRGRGRGDRGGRGGFQRGRGDRSNGYNREQRPNSSGSQQRFDGMSTPQQPSYSSASQSWSPPTAQQPAFNFAQQFPPPPPPAMFAQQGQGAQQPAFNAQAWAQFIQQQAAQTPQQPPQWPQQQQQYPQGTNQGQAVAQAAQNLAAMIQSMTQQNQNRQT